MRGYYDFSKGVRGKYVNRIAKEGQHAETVAPLEIELGVFEENRRAWAKAHLGKFVVIQDRNVMDGFFDSYEDAFRMGAQRFGTQRNFLIKQIWEIDKVYFVG